MPASKPIAYRALAQELREDIARGAFGSERRLPTEAELSASHKLSRQTVRRAVQELVAEGLVYRVRRRGTFAVASAGLAQTVRYHGPLEDLAALSPDSWLETTAPLTRRVDLDAAGRLQLDTDLVAEGRFRRVRDGVPLSITRIFLPPIIADRLLERGVLSAAGKRIEGAVVTTVDAVLTTPIVGAHQSITAIALPAGLGESIDLETGTPVLRVDRLYFDADERPVQMAISFVNPEQYSYRLELRRAG